MQRSRILTGHALSVSQFACESRRLDLVLRCDVISSVALCVSLIHRRADIARAEAAAVRARVWEILNDKAGIRTVDALDATDGKTSDRVTLLARTVTQLGVAGATELGKMLRALVALPWGSEANDMSRKARDAFSEAATEFMRPSPPR